MNSSLSIPESESLTGHDDEKNEFPDDVDAAFAMTEGFNVFYYYFIKKDKYCKKLDKDNEVFVFEYLNVLSNYLCFLSLYVNGNL